MRALLPVPSDQVDLTAAYEPGRGQFVRCNMISSVDGAISVGGRSGALGGPPDRRVFQVLRSWADVVLVGAGTIRAESYGPVRLDQDLRDARIARGCPPVPPIAVVTGSGDFDWSSPFFSSAEVRPLVVTTTPASDGVRRTAGDLAEVVEAGGQRVDAGQALDRLAEAGHHSVFLEGGPSLNADVVAAGRLDELCLTLSPTVVAGTGPRVFAGSELMPPIAVEPLHLLEEGGLFFWRLAIRHPVASG